MTRTDAARTLASLIGAFAFAALFVGAAVPVLPIA